MSMPEITGFMPKAARKLLFYSFGLFIFIFYDRAGLVPKRLGLKVLLDVLARLLAISDYRSKLGFGLRVFCLRPFFVAAGDLGSLRFTKLS